MAGDGNRSRFGGVMKLPMTAFGSSQAPAFLLQMLDHVANLQSLLLALSQNKHF
jgi:hypothetical protein